MKKIYYYIIFALLITGLGSFFLYQQYNLIQNKAYEELKISTSVYLLDKAGRLVNPEDFYSADSVSQNEVFGNLWKSIQSPEVVRIKIWNSDYKIIWSDLSELIGKSFPNYEDVEEALDGEVELEIIRGNLKNESITERQYVELSEIYVPYADNDGKIVGVIEIYQPTIILRQTIQEDFYKTAIPIILLAIVGYFIIAVALRFLLKSKLL
ncbi:MAG: hypothetical protein Q7T34_02780 [Candidatus Parcubacteria bacterium]|nr:hypothetical protein [Candidatus Parcubacteria bacterium]